MSDVKRSLDDVQSQRETTDGLLRSTTPTARSVVGRWLQYGDPEDPFRYTDRGSVYEWRVNNATSQIVTGVVRRVLPEPGSDVWWRINATTGTVDRGTPWLRKVAVMDGADDTGSGRPLERPWGISAQVAVVVLDSLPLAEADELVERIQAFFGDSAVVTADHKLAHELGVATAFRRE
jgi:hypothetical protein